MSTALRNRYVTAALKERRAILAGELQQLRTQAARHVDALAHVDAVLAMFAPEVDPNAIPLRRVPAENPHCVPHAARRILAILRRRGEAMSTADIAATLSAELGFGPEAAAGVAQRCRIALRDLSKGERASVLKTGWRTGAMWSLR